LRLHFMSIFLYAEETQTLSLPPASFGI